MNQYSIAHKTCIAQIHYYLRRLFWSSSFCSFESAEKACVSIRSIELSLSSKVFKRGNLLNAYDSTVVIEFPYNTIDLRFRNA